MKMRGKMREKKEKRKMNGAKRNLFERNSEPSEIKGVRGIEKSGSRCPYSRVGGLEGSHEGEGGVKIIEKRNIVGWAAAAPRRVAHPYEGKEGFKDV